MLKGIQTLITPEEYEKISGAAPGELMELTKSEIIKVVESFKNSYKADWEAKASAHSAEELKEIFKLMDVDDQSFSTSSVSSADFAAELSSIDFEKIIGGPLNACVTAQTNASLATVDFIKEVGFDENNKIRMVDFSHKKVKANPNLGKTIPDDMLRVLERRNLIEKETLQIKEAKKLKGKIITNLTSSVIKTGIWRNVRFKPYNVSAHGKKINSG